MTIKKFYELLEEMQIAELEKSGAHPQIQSYTVYEVD